METLRPLLLSNVINNVCSIAPAYESEDYAGAWNIYAAHYGTPEQVDVNRKITREAFSKLRVSIFIQGTTWEITPAFK